ncbi:hypothetical protein [Streptomyces sp. NBC_01006]|uniref:hypothetical protein n=1 Tax=Streptomyces sp. NBC_01006 TaxID=2903716 RepID=UPI002F9079ED|nr:hypothetical protein OG509_41865 [Streptomyces sp. NBC_01006]
MQEHDDDRNVRLLAARAHIIGIPCDTRRGHAERRAAQSATSTRSESGRGHCRHVDGIGTDHGAGALWPGRHGGHMDGFEFGACEGDMAWLSWVCSWA